MTAESAEDRLAMVSTADFGTEATFKGAVINGIFDPGYAEALDGEETPVDSIAYRYTTPAELVAGVEHGDELIISGTAYAVRSIQPDGSGLVRLYLEIE